MSKRRTDIRRRSAASWRHETYSGQPQVKYAHAALRAGVSASADGEVVAVPSIDRELQT